MGAFGLNVSIIDTSNLAWKIGMCCKGQAKLETLLPTYDYERRMHANRVIEVSGTYLRFVCGSSLGIVDLRDQGKDLGMHTVEKMKEGESRTLLTPDAKNASPDEAEARGFLLDFFNTHGMFLLGLDVAYGQSVINPALKPLPEGAKRPITVKNGVRAPNPRVCFDASHTGYLYDKMAGSSKLHLLVFGSDLRGPVRRKLADFSKALRDPHSFYNQFGGKDLFNVVLVAKGVPFEIEDAIQGHDISALRETAIVLSDDRAPDEDAHTTYGVNHTTGALVIVRPDLWVGTSTAPDELKEVEAYLSSFLIPVTEWERQSNGLGPAKVGMHPIKDTWNVAGVEANGVRPNPYDKREVVNGVA
jgi:phenol 2-monooxygenase (NADPH)